MSEPIDELVLKISADVAGVKAGLTQVAQLSEQLAAQSKRHGDVMTESFIKAQIAIELLKRGLEAIKEFTVDAVKDVLKNVEAQDQLAQRLNVTYGFVAALKVQGEEFGVSAEQMANAVLHLSRNLGSVKDSSSPVIAALDKLKLNYEDVINLKPEDQYKTIANAFAKLTDQTERTAVAQALYGREGLQLVGILRQGSAGFDEAAEKAKKFGLALTPENVATIRQANAAWRDVHNAVEGLATTLTVKLAPYIVGVANAISDAAGDGDAFGETMDGVIKFVIKLVDGFRAELRGLEIAWAAIKLAVIGVGDYTVSAIEIAVRSIVYAGETLGGFGRALQRTEELIEQTFKSGFALALSFVQLRMADIVQVFATTMQALGEQMTKYGVKGAADVISAAGTAQNAVGAMQQAARVGATDAGIAFDNAAADAKYAWEHVMPDWNATAVPGLTDFAQTMHEAFADSYDDLQAIMEKPFDVHAFEDWASHIVKIVHDASNKIAAERTADASQEQHVNIQKQNWDAQTWDQKLGYATSTMNSLGELMEHGSRRQFEIGKKLQLAAAIADTAAGVAKTFQQFGWYALLGPAEAVAAAGAVQIAKISQMQYGGGGGGGGGAGISAAPSQAAGPGVTGQAGQGQTVTIALQGAVFNQQTIRGLASQLNDFVRDGGQLAGVRVQG